MKGKMLSMMAIFVMTLIAMCGLVVALPNVEYIKINGDVFEDGDQLVVELGETLDIRVKMNATQDEENVKVEAQLVGYEYDDYEDISDSAHLFDMDVNTTEYKNMRIVVPEKMDKDYYDLKVEIGTRKGADLSYVFPLKIKGARHKLMIKDVVFSPEDNVRAGRSLLTTVRIKNYGERNEGDIKVKVSIPELGISAADYIDEIEEEDSTTSEELYMRIPDCSEPGIYDVEVEVEYDEYDRASETKTIAIVEGDFCESQGQQPQQNEQPNQDTPVPQTIISVGSLVQQLNKGEGGVIYPLTISNAGKQAKSYTVSVEGADAWATISINPTATTVLQPGEAKAIYIYVSANEDAAVGEHMFSATVTSNGDVLKQIPLTSQVTESAQQDSWEKVKRGLEIGLVILVVLLVILGLIIGFNKLKEGKDEDEDEDSQTYY